jgi:hypothetical protein
MNKILGVSLFLILAIPAYAENYLLNGRQASQINYEMIQKIRPPQGIRSLVLSYVIPKSFDSPTYSQKIKDLSLHFSPEPSKRKDRTDIRGNKVLDVTWKTPMKAATTTIRMTALNNLNLQTLKTRAPFPLSRFPKHVKVYLKSTQQVNVNNQEIREKARALTVSSSTEFDAVQRVLTWVVDHMQYILTPKSFDAIYAFQNGRGNCQNYSHLSAALLRAVGIPVKIVNGITLKQPYDIKIGDNTLTMKMAQGRHSWIEVYFPDLGWVTFDPQGTELFVSNRFIRIEVGLDNNETVQDGLIRWTQTRGTSAEPQLEEKIYSGFVDDRVKLHARKTDYGPRKLLLCPQIEAAFSKISVSPPPPLPPKLAKKELKRLQYVKSYVFGNLEFPENVDFLASYGPARPTVEGTMEMRKNVVVETAEYVTTQGKQYAQTFILNKPLQLQKVGLALHKFSDDGQLWLELIQDNDGKPRKPISASEIITLKEVLFTPGYSWVDFDFSKSSVILSPGRYWVALGFTGSPIVNWFFSYGKPVGPQDGTRYKMIFDATWSRSLAYEFNYRISGLTAE